MLQRSKALLAGVALAALAGAPAAGGRDADAEPLAGWTRGPVRYLLSRAEEKEFRRLEDEEARAQFIARFWQRWDPTPGTLENETRREYWRRIQEANRRFVDSARPGWMTDRGRIYILLGEPDEAIVEEDTHVRDLPRSSAKAQDAAGDTGRVLLESASRGLLRWTYRNLPGRTTDPEVIVAFVRDASGEWRVSRSPEYYTAAFPGLTGGTLAATPSGFTPKGAGFGPDGSQAGQAQAFLFEAVSKVLLATEVGRKALIGLDLGEATSVPQLGEALAEIVTSREFLARLPLTSRFTFFRAEDGNTQVRIGLSVRSADLYGSRSAGGGAASLLFVYARFSPEAGEEAVYYTSNENRPEPVDASLIADPGARLEVWVERTLPPGRYEVAVGLQDAATGTASSLRTELVVPDLTDGAPELSSIEPASRLELVEGTLTAKARVSSLYRRDEQLGVYYQVYNLQTREGRPSIRVTYRILAHTAEDRTPVGRPIVYEDQSEPTQGWSVPLERWPPGSYTLEVTAEDTIGGGSVSGLLDFEVL